MTDHAIADTFDSIWRRHGSQVAIREGSLTLTYRELLRASEGISHVLELILDGPGQGVAVLLPNSAAFVASAFAIVRVGGVAAPLNPEYTSREVARYVVDLDVAAIVTAPRFVEPLTAILAERSLKPAIIEVPSPALTARLITTGTHAARRLTTRASMPALVQYTSGSTGSPKQVVRTHVGVLAELDVLRERFQITEDDKFLGAAPFCHVNGLIRTMMTSMYGGATLFPLQEFRRRDVVELITSERITFFGGVPGMFVILSHMPVRGDTDLSSLRLVFSSSAPLLLADHKRFHARYGIAIRQLYGSTETGTISFNSEPTPERCPQSVGTPLEGVRIDVLDAEGRVTQGEGEFAIASRFAASEYLNNPSATEESFRDGFYLSGDLGLKGESGTLMITGRKKLMINHGGFKVNPYEVEEVIREYPKVTDVAVFGTPSPYGDDVVSCVIVASEPCSPDDITAHCRDRIASYKIPTRVEFRDTLPTSPTGKILRAVLAAGLRP